MKLIDADKMKEVLGISGSCGNCKHNGIFGCRDDVPVGKVCSYIYRTPSVDAIPIEWIENYAGIVKYAKPDDTAAPFYRMLEEWWKAEFDKEWKESNNDH